MVNSTSTIASRELIEFSNCGLLILRKGLPNKPKHKASRMVDLPAPFCPMINVFCDLVKSISVNTLPVDNRFFQRIFRNNIMLVQYSMPLRRVLSINFLVQYYLYYLL